MKLPRHPLVLAVKPIIEALGAQLVPLDSREPGDLPLKWEGAEVAAVRMAPLHGALDRLIEGVEREFGTRLPLLTREEKQRAIRLLDERGAFTLRRAVEDVSDAMGVSRITVYNYLNALHREIVTPYDVIGFDADDTLWQSEDGFRGNELRFVELIQPFAPEGIDVAAALTATERKNLSTFGYGVKSFAISMVEAAITITRGTVSTAVIMQLVDMARSQLEETVQLLPHVPEVLAKVGAAYKLVLITKGDLVHQTHKITTSGLAHHFDHLEIVLEKDIETYAGLLKRFGVQPDRFLMVGNSVRSDILPVMALGGHAVHVPYHLLWELEHVEHDELFTELSSLADLPAVLGL